MYFRTLGRVPYQFPDDVTRVFNNLSKRAAMSEELMRLSYNMEPYLIQDGDTPEGIAYDNYDDVELHWVIFLANNLTNYVNDWPIHSVRFEDFIYKKYRNQKTTRNLDITLTKTETLEFTQFKGLPDRLYTDYITRPYEGMFTDYVVRMRPRHFVDDNGQVYSYDTIGITKDAFGNSVTNVEVFPVSHYQYEFEINEKKRQIVIPPKTIAARMKSQLGTILNG